MKPSEFYCNRIYDSTKPKISNKDLWEELDKKFIDKADAIDREASNIKVEYWKDIAKNSVTKAEYDILKSQKDELFTAYQEKTDRFEALKEEHKNSIPIADVLKIIDESKTQCYWCKGCKEELKKRIDKI